MAAHPGRARLLGHPTVEGPTGTTVAVRRPQIQLALAYLLVERRAVSHDELADVLWGDRPLSPHWRGAVRGVISKLRGLFEDAGVDAAVVRVADGTVALRLPEGFEVDLHEAADAVAAGGAEASGWADRLDARVLAAADGEWVRSLQDRVARLARQATVAAIEHDLAHGRPDLAVLRAGSWIQRHPVDEPIHHLRIDALEADGRLAEARAARDLLGQVLATELGVAPQPLTTAPRAPLEPVEGSRDRGFLGRSRELERIGALLAKVMEARRPAAVSIEGPSGIGKTRLAREVVARAADRGAQVWWAACTASGAAPFEPLATAVLGTEQLGAPSPVDDPATARARLRRELQMAVPTDRAAVLVIDDLQWAGDDVLGLLRDLMEQAEAPLLLVATGRDLPPAAHQLLADLHRWLAVESLELAGLELTDLVHLFHGGGGTDAAEVHRRTGGHPFFVAELARASAESGRLRTAMVPDAVRDWIRHRAEALDPAHRDLLDLAAALGVEVDASVLAAIAQLTVVEVDDTLELLVDRGFLVADPEPDRYAFAHLITRDAVYERLRAGRRARLHARIGTELARLPWAPGRHRAVAHHLRLAGPDHASAAAAHAAIASTEALERGAWALAEELAHLGLPATDQAPAVRASLLTSLGRSLHHQRRRAEAEATLEDALAVARAHALPVELGEAALALVGRAGRGASQRRDDAAQAALLREAIEALEQARPPDDHHDHVRRERLACELDNELALALLLTEPPEVRAALTERSLARARRLEPPDTRLTSRALLATRIAKHDPVVVHDRLADLDQVLAIAPTGRSVETTVAAHTYRHEDLLRIGRRDEAAIELATAREAATAIDHPYWRWATATWEALGATVDGRLDDAEALAEAALAGCGEVDGALACFGVNLVNIRLYQGRSGEVLDLLGRAANDHPEIPCYRAVLALCALEAGERSSGERAYRWFLAQPATAIPDDPNRLLTLQVLADAAVQLGDVDGAIDLGRLLEPYRDQHAILNCYGGGGAYWGPVAHQLARIASLADLPEEAEALFEQAEEAATRLGAEGAARRIASDPRRSTPHATARPPA